MPVDLSGFPAARTPEHAKTGLAGHALTALEPISDELRLSPAELNRIRMGVQGSLH